MTVRLGRRRTAIIAATCVVLTACGSQVPPNQFYEAGAGRSAGAVGVVTAPTAAASSAAAAASGGALSGGTAGTAGHAGTAGSAGNAGGAGATTAGGPLAGVKVGSCAGFADSTGITDSQIDIANIADLSGPVPGLFKSAQAAVTAYVAYFNSQASICGRKLKLMGLDSGTSESGDQQATVTACSQAFAAVGSMGAFDAGGASTAAGCGLPDLRTASTETARYQSPTSFGAYSLAVPEVPEAPFDYFKTLGNGAYQNAAFVYLDAGASTLNADSFSAAETKMGFTFKTKIAIDVTSVVNYPAYATQLQSQGIQYVQYLGAYQYAQKLKAAFAAQNYNPIFVMDPTAYTSDFVSGGSAMNGTYVFIAGPLFEEAAKDPQLQTYLTWLQRTSGGAPSFFGMYAWCAAALFVQLSAQLGGKLTRANLVSAIKGVSNYTNFGMVPPQQVGSKQSPNCVSVIQLENGQWVRRTPYPWTCGALVNSGVGN